MPRFKSAQDVPLLVVYSSELECEKYFAFWCACRAGKVCHVIEATDNNGIPSPPCIAFERAVLAKPISEVLWLKIDIHSGGHTPEALESQVIHTYKLREGCDIVAVTCPLCCVHVCACLCVCVAVDSVSSWLMFLMSVTAFSCRHSHCGLPEHQ